MSILVAALLSAALPTPRPASDYLASVRACLEAINEGGADERKLIDSGWFLTKEDEDEAHSGAHFYTNKKAPPIIVVLHSGRIEACQVWADAPVVGGRAALFATFDGALGLPATPTTVLSSGVLRSWHLPHHSILFGSGASENAQFSFNVMYVFQYPGTSK